MRTHISHSASATGMGYTGIGVVSTRSAARSTEYGGPWCSSRRRKGGGRGSDRDENQRHKPPRRRAGEPESRKSYGFGRVGNEASDLSSQTLKRRSAYDYCP